MCVQDYMGPTISSTFPPLHKIAYIFSLRKLFLLAHQRPLFFISLVVKDFVNVNFVTCGPVCYYSFYF